MRKIFSLPLRLGMKSCAFVESLVVFYWVCYGCVSLFRFVTFRPKPELLEDELTGHVSIRTAFYFYFLTAVYLEMILGDNKKAVKHE